MLRTIAHPTDFSRESGDAFAHALRLAVATRSQLHVLHVKSAGADDAWGSFPHVREMLARWGLMDAHEPPGAIEAKIGIRVHKIEIEHRDAATGLFRFAASHRPDLMVGATHGREGLNRWLAGSVSHEIARRTRAPTLLLGPEAQGFVVRSTGEMRLRSILLPVGQVPSPTGACNMLAGLLDQLGVTRQGVLPLHVGDDPPRLPEKGAPGAHPVRVENGPVVETILRVARECQVDMIAMPTAGRHGFLDALRGSTTEQVLRRAPCPLLAVVAA